VSFAAGGEERKKNRVERAGLDCDPGRFSFLIKSSTLFESSRRFGWFVDKGKMGYWLSVSRFVITLSMYPFNRSYRNSFLSNYYSIKMAPIDSWLTILVHFVNGSVCHVDIHIEKQRERERDRERET